MKTFVASFSLVCSLIGFAQALPAQVEGTFVNTGSMNVTREADVQVTLLTGKALVAGGTDGTNVLASAEVYDPSKGVWTLTGSLATPRESFAGVVLKSGKVLVVGGLGAASIFLASAELYDPSTGKWFPAGALATARYGHTATLLESGKVLVAGGCNASPCGSLTDSELYDPATNNWIVTGRLATPRASHTATLLGSGEVLVTGGRDGIALNSCELYNPATGKWFSANNMSTARFAHAATLLKSGKVLVTGGTTNRFPIGSAELYDPTFNTWTLTASMLTGRYGHTSTLLADATVLVAGGEGQSISCGKACTSYIPTAKTEIYNEAASKFTATASLTRAQAYHTTSVLGTEKALADGGIGYTATCCVVLSAAELYTPLTFTFSATSLNFGFRQVEVPSPQQTVTVTNVSSHSVTFSSIKPSGDYSESNDCPITPNTLNSGLRCNINVTFTPKVTGTRNGSITLSDNAPGSSPQIITATGTGEPYAFAVSPPSYSFPSILPGSSEMTTVTVLNDAATPVNLMPISISPADGVFTQTNNCPATLMPGQRCIVQVTFMPPDSVAYNATLLVTDSSSQTQATTVTGSGID